MFVDYRPGDRFVDLGPGNGAAVSLAPYLLPNPQVGCIEFSARTVEFLRRHSPGITVGESITELTDQWGEKSIAVLYSAHCLEHFGARELGEALASFRRSLRPGGALVIEVPFAPPSRVTATSRHTPHLIFFTPDGLEKLLNRHGFAVRLCTVGPGSTANSVKWVRSNYPVPDPAVVGGRLAALNHKDFVSRDPAVLESKAGAGVIKCVATPSR
jgi:SAM-dependent methyltransferase